MHPDLTPFGFTATESAAYGTLLDLGPSSGYAVAKALGIARANGYQALDGLVGKGAAMTSDERPKRYRAVKPTDLFSRIAAREAAQLERLEAELAGHQGDGAEPLVAISGRRAVQEVLSRHAVRSSGPVECLAPRAFLELLIPAWRARRRKGVETTLWNVAEAPAPGSVGGVPIAPSRRGADLPDGIALLLTESGGFVGRFAEEPAGFWTSHPELVVLIRASIAWASKG